MLVQASLQFSCATTGRNLETQLSTEARNLDIFRRGNVRMRCAFCGQQHRWRLIKYHRADIPDMKHRHNAPSTRRQKRASHIAPSTPGAIDTIQVAQSKTAEKWAHTFPQYLRERGTKPKKDPGIFAGVVLRGN